MFPVPVDESSTFTIRNLLLVLRKNVLSVTNDGVKVGYSLIDAPEPVTLTLDLYQSLTYLEPEVAAGMTDATVKVVSEPPNTGDPPLFIAAP